MMFLKTLKGPCLLLSVIAFFSVSCSTLQDAPLDTPRLPSRGTIQARTILAFGNQQIDTLAIVAYLESGEYRVQFYTEMGVLLMDFGYRGDEVLLYSIPDGFPEVYITRGLHLDILTLIYGEYHKVFQEWDLNTASGTVSVFYNRIKPRYQAQWQFLSIKPEVAAEGLFQ